MKKPSQTPLSRKRLGLYVGLLSILSLDGAVLHLLLKKKPADVPSSAITPGPSTVTIAGNNMAQTGDLLQGNWQFLPASIKTDLGLRITPLNYTLMQQSGATGEANPPINLAGSYVDHLTGNFTMNMALNPLQSTNQTIQLYGRTPIIADEFRVERESIRLKFEAGVLTVSVWQAQQQAPTTTTILNYPNLNDVNMTLTRQGNDLAITVNDAVAGHIDITNVFNAGQMWFGFDGQNEWILNKLNVSSLDGGSFTVADSSATIIAQHDPKGLQVLATQKRSDFIVGAAMALGPMTTDPQYANVALDKNMFGSFTPENEMKMINLQPKQGVYSFSKADAMIQLAQQNGINTIHGHTLVFGEANPAWLNALPVASAADKAHIEQIMIDHITTVVKHFGDKVTSWDVVNEPLADYDEFNPNNGQIWRNHKWYQSMGRDFIVKAIVAAHQANPNARLFINEFGLEQDGERWDTFMAQLSWLKQELTAKGVPIEKIGIGMQAHVYESGDVIPAAQLQAHMRQLAALGFKVQISEMDVYTDDGDAIQGQQYADVFMACLNEPNCVAWRAWILSDRYNVWKEDEGSNAINFGKDGLFDTSMQPRPGVIQIQQRLQ